MLGKNFGGCMRKLLFVGLIVLVGLSLLEAQSTRNARHVVPTGKGWGVEVPRDIAPLVVITGNGINYHGGPVIKGTMKAYFIWYGNWTNGPHASDSQTTVNLLGSLFGSSGLNGSSYFRINTTYGDNSGNVSGYFFIDTATTENYSQGTGLTDSRVQSVVSSAITSGRLPKDTNALYFVLTSSDVRETSGFCTQ